MSAARSCLIDTWPAPGAGVIEAINRGERRSLQSVVIRLEGDDSEEFLQTDSVNSLSREEIAGNLLALLQTNVKRILAYSSIAHFGYMLVAFVAGGAMAVEAVTFYLMAYTVTTLGAFGVVGRPACRAW